jgi:hypothetical protein
MWSQGDIIKVAQHMQKIPCKRLMQKIPEPIYNAPVLEPGGRNWGNKVTFWAGDPQSGRSGPMIA